MSTLNNTEKNATVTLEFAENLNHQQLKNVNNIIAMKNVMQKQTSKDSLGVITKYEKNFSHRIATADGINLFTSNAEIKFLEENVLLVEINTFANVLSSSTIEENGIFYDFDLSIAGLPKLTIYIRFAKASSEYDKPGILHSNFECYFDSTGNKLDFQAFDNIEVFLIDEDPRTSRGTVTTVSQPTK